MGVLKLLCVDVFMYEPQDGLGNINTSKHKHFNTSTHQNINTITQSPPSLHPAHFQHLIFHFLHQVNESLIAFGFFIPVEGKIYVNMVHEF